MSLEDFRYFAHGLLDCPANHVGVLRSSQVLGVASPNVAVDGNSEVDHVAREELVGKEMCKERDVKSVVDECFLFEVGEGEVICLLWIQAAKVFVNGVGKFSGTWASLGSRSGQSGGGKHREEGGVAWNSPGGWTRGGVLTRVRARWFVGIGIGHGAWCRKRDEDGGDV